MRKTDCLADNKYTEFEAAPFLYTFISVGQ